MGGSSSGFAISVPHPQEVARIVAAAVRVRLSPKLLLELQARKSLTRPDTIEAAVEIRETLREIPEAEQGNALAMAQYLYERQGKNS